jgi:hypothetical protein
MIPKERRKTPPPTPSTARPRSSSQRVCASAEMSDPTTNTPRTATSVVFFPKMSPRRPISGAATAAATRYTVMTHVTETRETPRSLCITGSAGAIIAAIRA